MTNNRASPMYTTQALSYPAGLPTFELVVKILYNKHQPLKQHCHYTTQKVVQIWLLLCSVQQLDKGTHTQSCYSKACNHTNSKLPKIWWVHNAIILVTRLCVDIMLSSRAEWQTLKHDVDHAHIMVGYWPKGSIWQIHVCHVSTAPLLVGGVWVVAWAGVCDHDADCLITDAARIWELGVWQSACWPIHTWNGVAHATLPCMTALFALAWPSTS